MLLEAKSSIRFEGYVVDRPGWTLRWADEPIALNRKSFDLLLYLVDHRDRVVSKEELLETLWAGQFVEESNLTQQIFLLRKALSRHESGRKIIETVPGRGYRFTAALEVAQRAAPQEQILQQIVLNTSQSITRITLEEETEDGESGVWPVVPITLERDKTIVPISAVPGDALEQTSSIDIQRDTGNPQHLNRWMPIAISVCILMIGIAVFFLYYRSAQRPRVLASAPPTEVSVRVARPSLAVLSLQNTSGLSKDAWLSNAIAEMLTNELNSDDRLRIVPRTAVAEATHDLGFAPSAYSSSTLAALHVALGSALIVQGSYSLDSASPDVTVHLTLQVQDASTGKARTEISETGRLNDLFALVHESSFTLRNALFAGKQQLANDPQSLAGLSSNTDAMRLYTEGLEQLRAFDMQSARSFFERAIEADAGFALAHVALSETWSELGYVERAKQEAAEAFRLSSNLPRPQKLSIEALYRDSFDDVPRAIAIYKALATFYPDEAEWSLKLAVTQHEAGQYKDAINTLEALRRIPLTPSEEVELDRDESWSYLFLGLHEAENLEKARDIVVAGLSVARKQGGTLILARALRSECSVLVYIKPQDAAVEACDQARKIFEAVGNLDAVAAVTNNLAVIRQDHGELTEALTGFQQAEHLYHEIGNLHDEMAMLENEALLNVAVGNLPVALQQAKAVAHAKNTGSDKDCASEGDQYMTMAYTSQGRLKEARFAGMAGLDLANTFSDEATQKFTRATFLELLGRIDSMAGDFDQARKRWKDALVLQKGVGNSLAVADLDVDLVDLDLQQGHPREDMVKSLRDDFAAFATDTQTVDYQLRARLITAKAQLALGHISDAAATLAALNALDGKGNWENSHLQRFLVQASVQQAQHLNAEAVATLQQEIQQASDKGFLYLQMEGEIALARLQHQIASSLHDSSRLKSLAQEANQYGYKGLASAAGESKL